MKRTLASALLLSAISGFGLVGCGEEAGTTTKTETTGPGGTTTKEDTTKVNTSGSNPPAPASDATAPK